MFIFLKDKLEHVCSQRRHENMVAYSKEVEVPLKTSKKIVLLTAATYDTEFSLKLYVSILMYFYPFRPVAQSCILSRTMDCINWKFMWVF